MTPTKLISIEAGYALVVLQNMIQQGSSSLASPWILATCIGLWLFVLNGEDNCKSHFVPLQVRVIKCYAERGCFVTIYVKRQFKNRSEHHKARSRCFFLMKQVYTLIMEPTTLLGAPSTDCTVGTYQEVHWVAPFGGGVLQY